MRLRGYQQEAVDKIFGKGGLIERGKSSALVTLPTGGGKSFVGMATMAEIMESANDPEHPEVISNTPMLYLSPTNVIMGQYRIHMSQHMIFERYIEMYMRDNDISIEGIPDIAKDILRKYNPNVEITEDSIQKVIDRNVELYRQKGKEITDKEALDILRRVLKSQLSKQSERTIEEGVRRAFPALDFKCNDDMRSREKGDVIDNKDGKLFYVEDVDPKLVIIDEAHRAGSNSWRDYLKRLVKGNKDCFYLSITATPERDADDESVIEDIARETGYTQTEIRRNEYIAKSLSLVDAMKQNLISIPEVVHFDFLLDHTKEYQEMKEACETLRAKRKNDMRAFAKNVRDQRKLQIYEALLANMDLVMGRPVGISDQEWEAMQQKMIRETISNSGLSPNAKGIGFIPRTLAGENSIRHVKAWEGIIADYLSGPDQQETAYVRGYHSVYSDGDNERTLREFNGGRDDSDERMVIISNQKLDEGVHVDDTEMLFMCDYISAENTRTLKEEAKIRFLQQVGRGIHSIDPEHADEDVRPIIFDMEHNFMRHREYLTDKNGRYLYGLTGAEAKLLELYDIFRQVSSDKIKPQSVGRITRKNEQTGQDEIVTKINLGGNKSILITPELPSIEDQYFKKQDVKKVNLSVGTRYNNVMSILKVLKEHGIDVKDIGKDEEFDRGFLERRNIPEDEIERILDDLSSKRGIKKIVTNLGSESYKIGSEIDFFRSGFYKGTPMIQKTMLQSKVHKFDYKELVDAGLLYLSPEQYKTEGSDFKEFIDKNGFIKPCTNIPEELWDLNVQSGERLLNGKDVYGLNEDGYDDLGFDRYGFNREGIHRITGQDFDERFFRRKTEIDEETGETREVWENIMNNGKPTDRLGYNHDGIDAYGFSRFRFIGGSDEQIMARSCKHHPQTEDGEFSRIEEECDEAGGNFRGFKIKRGRNYNKIVNKNKGRLGSRVSSRRFYVDGTSDQTGTFRDLIGRDIDGLDERGFNPLWVHVDTSYTYGPDAKDRHGLLEPNLEFTINLLQAFVRGKTMTPEEIAREYKVNVEDIDDMINNGFTTYYMSPDFKSWPKDLSTSRLIQTGALKQLGALSPKAEKQLQFRFDYKLRYIEVLENRLKELEREGKTQTEEYRETLSKRDSAKQADMLRDYDLDR